MNKPFIVKSKCNKIYGAFPRTEEGHEKALDYIDEISEANQYDEFYIEGESVFFTPLEE